MLQTQLLRSTKITTADNTSADFMYVNGRVVDALIRSYGADIEVRINRVVWYVTVLHICDVSVHRQHEDLTYVITIVFGFIMLFFGIKLNRVQEDYGRITCCRA
jgi:hypothetical protein